MTPNAEEIKSLSQTLAEFAEWATQERTLAEFIEYKMLKVAVDLHALKIAQLKAKWESVPWSAIAYCVNVADRVAPKPETVEAFNWLAANAPKEAAE